MTKLTFARVLVGLVVTPGLVSSVEAGATDKLYWTDSLSQIQRADLDGANVQNLVAIGPVVARGIAVDQVRGKVYWTERDTARIRRADLDGSNAEDVVTAQPAPHGIAVDPVGAKIYWVNGGPSAKYIRRANLDGTDVEDLVTTPPLAAIYIALDVNAGKMYWSDAATNGIRRANLDGSNVVNLISDTGVFGIELDLDAGKMYWTDPIGFDIQRANLDGSDIQNVVTGVPDPYGVTIGPAIPASPAVPALSRVGLVLVVGLTLAASWLVNRPGTSSS